MNEANLCSGSCSFSNQYIVLRCLKRSVMILWVPFACRFENCSLFPCVCDALISHSESSFGFESYAFKVSFWKFTRQSVETNFTFACDRFSENTIPCSKRNNLNSFSHSDGYCLILYFFIGRNTERRSRTQADDASLAPKQTTPRATCLHCFRIEMVPPHRSASIKCKQDILRMEGEL